MKKSYYLLLLVSLITLISIDVNAQFEKVKGEGEVVKQERNTGEFKVVQSYGSFDIVVKDGNSHSVQVEAQENLQPYIIAEVVGNKLKIRQKKGVHLKTDKSIKIFVTAPSFQSLQLYGSGNITGENQLSGEDDFEISSAGSGNIDLDLEATSVKADIEGSGNITLKGKTKELEGRIQGSGNIKAKEMQSSITSVNIAGSGNAEVVANEKLSSKIAGSGDIKYWGDASVDSKVAGSGKISRVK